MLDAPSQETDRGMMHAGGRLNFWKELWKQITNAGPTSALKAMGAAEMPFDKAIADFNKMLSDAADALNKKQSINPNFAAEVNQERSKRTERNTLTENQRIGAFAYAYNTQIDVARQSLMTQKAMDAKLDIIAKKPGGIPGYGGN